MSEFSFQVGFSVQKELPPISDPLVDVNFCSSTGASQTPPTLRFNLGVNGTASVAGVVSACKTIGVGTGTNATSLVTSTPFGTNAAASYMLITETSGSPSAFATVYSVAGPSRQTFSTIGAGGCLLIRQASGIGYAASCSNSTSTARLQVVVIGEQ